VSTRPGLRDAFNLSPQCEIIVTSQTLGTDWAATANCYVNKKHSKNVGPIRHCEPPHACHSPGVATVARRLRIDVHDNNDNDNAWQRDRYGPIEWAQYSAIGISFSQLHHCCILAMRHPITEQQLLVSREQHMDNVWSDCQSQLDDLGFLAMRAIANVV